MSADLKEKEKTWDADLSQSDLARAAIEMYHCILAHHMIWFMEVEHQMGFDEALNILSDAYPRSYSFQINRLAKALGIELVDGLPKPLVELPREKLLNLIDNISINWLTNDGVWFQAVEFKHGMFDAKRCNDSCWVRFSPFEAWAIKRFRGLGENSGLEGLKDALEHRMYARINVQSFEDDGPNSFVFRMNDCRVQSARKKQKLDDYPCKSAGLIEYQTFSKSIDARIKTECICCPPDDHPDDCYCAWRFTLIE